MKKLFCFWIFFCTNALLNTVLAQWTQKDSLWLQNILSGKDSLILNPETKKAILEGNFINLDKPHIPMRSVPLEIPLVKDFSEYIQPSDSTTATGIALKDLPPGVFWLYKPKDVTRFSKPELVVNPAFFISGASTEGARSPSGHDFMGALAYMLNKEYRQQVKNQKNATSWKYYNDIPDMELQNKRFRFQKSRPDLILAADGSLPNARPLPLPLVKSKIKRDSLANNLSFSVRDSVFPVIEGDSLGYRMLRDSILLPVDSILLHHNLQ